ncbi:hypothetical protein NBRC116590_02920 [Pelagimonas sp. KU-00592-HH]|uniref:hypothetical protein n=1 Tax=Pelagimonas sp. KU-00592-HH TaxID=3127651 RepID=UPI0031070141
MDVIAEANRIKERFRKCGTEAELTRVKDEECEATLSMKDLPAPGPLMHQHIVALYIHRVQGFRSSIKAKL